MTCTSAHVCPLESSLQSAQKVSSLIPVNFSCGTDVPLETYDSQFDDSPIRFPASWMCCVPSHARRGFVPQHQRLLNFCLKRLKPLKMVSLLKSSPGNTVHFARSRRRRGWQLRMRSCQMRLTKGSKTNREGRARNGLQVGPRLCDVDIRATDKILV